jgi:hypothetical protein
VQEASVHVNVPGGFDAVAGWSRALRLRPCTGADEAWLVDEASGLLPAERATGLLGRCLRPEQDRDDGGVALARRLTVGDREALLLHLRRITIGDRLELVASCAPCGGRMNIDARVTDLVLPPYGHDGWDHEAALSACQVRFRLPNGADQEAAARAVEGDAAEATAAEPEVSAGVQAMLERCVREVRARGGGVLARLPSQAIPALSAAMAERDPQAEVVLGGHCPHCASPFAHAIDAGQILHEELAGDGEALFREVHTLASRYHWSEAEILSLTFRQRRRYLALIAEAPAWPRGA